MDNISKKLYINENFESFYARVSAEFFSKNTRNSEISKEESDIFSDEEVLYEHLRWESAYLIYDCFLGREYKTIEKILLIATYYRLTNDQEIVNILNQFSEHQKYSEYKTIITGRDYSKIMKLKN